MTNIIKKEVQEKVKKPDIVISAKKTFNISWEIEVPAFSQKDDYVPDVDENYYFEEDTTRAVLAGFKFNRRVPGYPNHPKNGQPHPAVCLLRVEDYWNVGGCEEDLVGHYGWTDPSFWYRSIGKLHVITYTDLYLDYCPEGEADINRDNSHNRKLYEDRTMNGGWSTDFVRFEWEKVK